VFNLLLSLDSPIPSDLPLSKWQTPAFFFCQAPDAYPFRLWIGINLLSSLEVRAVFCHGVHQIFPPQAFSPQVRTV